VINAPTLSLVSAGMSPRGTYPRVVSPPSGFPWAPSWKVIETAPGVFTTTLDPKSLRRTSTVTRYVNLARADNSGNGLSAATADKSIWAAVNAGFSDGAVVTVYVLGSADPENPTVYDYDNCWQSAWAFDGNCIVVSDFTALAPGYAVSSTYMRPGGAHLGTWALTADGAGPNVYEATLAAAPNAVIDATVKNATTTTHQRLTLRSSIATVEANPGSYWHSSGKLYVRTADSRAPDAKLRALRASVVNGHINTATVDAYIEGLTFEGGNARCLFIQAATSVALVNVTATHGQLEGLSLQSTTASGDYTLWLIGCQALDCDGDGLQYTVTGASAVARILEWNCIARANSGAGTEQGSTAHFTAGNTSVSIIRVNGTFSSNKTQGAADVGGCDSWLEGCRFASEGTGLYIGDDGTAHVHGCTFTGCTTDLVTDNAAGVINVADTHYATTSGAGTVRPYHP
jgi:hypothetical protein